MKALLYTHISLCLALLLGLVVLMAGLEPARSIDVSELDYKSVYVCTQCCLQEASFYCVFMFLCTVFIH